MDGAHGEMNLDHSPNNERVRPDLTKKVLNTSKKLKQNFYEIDTVTQRKLQDESPVQVLNTGDSRQNDEPVLNTGESKLLKEIDHHMGSRSKGESKEQLKHGDDAEGVGTGFDILDTHQIYKVELSVKDMPQELLVILKSQNNERFKDVKIPLQIILSNRLYAVLTTTLNDSGANIAMASHATMLKDGKLIKAAVAGLSEKSVIDHVGTLGKMTGVYSGKNLHKDIIPPQKFIEFTNGKIMLLHVQVKKRPPIHMVFGIQRNQPIKILSVSSPITNNIMVWTETALKLLGIHNYETRGKMTLITKMEKGNFTYNSVKQQEKQHVLKHEITVSEPEANNAAFKHIDLKNGEVELKKACLDGLSNKAIKNQRMTGLGASRDELSRSDEKLKLYELMAKFKRGNRPGRSERTTPIDEHKLLACIQVDVIFLTELESTGANKGIKTRGGYTAMLLAVDRFSRMSWVEPIRTEKQDFLGSLNIIFIKIGQLAKRLKVPPPIFIQTDKAANQRPQALKEFLINHKLILKPVMPKSNDLKILDRFVRSLRETTNLGIKRSDNLIEFSHEIMRESNRRLNYRTSVDGLRASPFEIVFGVVPSIDHVYPPQGTTTLVKASLHDKVGCTTGIYLYTNEDEGSYTIYLPRVDAVVVRQNVLFITLETLPGRLLKMMSGQRIFDEKELIQGHVVDLRDRLRGPVLVRCTDKPWKGAWYILKFDTQNFPTPEPFECTCMKTFNRLAELKRHWSLEVHKTRTESTDADKHPDPMIRPGSLNTKQKKRHKDFRNVEFEKLVSKSNAKNGTKLGRFTTYSEDQNTSQYNLRNRSVDGKDALETLRRTRVKEMKELRKKEIIKVKATKSVDRLHEKQNVKISEVKCPIKGCLALLPGTPSGRHSKLMREHLAQHKVEERKGQPRRSARNLRRAREVNASNGESKSSFRNSTKGTHTSKPENYFSEFLKETVEDDYFNIKSPLGQTQDDYNTQVKTALLNVYTASIEEARDTASSVEEARVDKNQKVQKDEDSQKGESKNELLQEEVNSIAQNYENDDDFEMHNIQTEYDNEDAEAIEKWFNEANVVGEQVMISQSMVNICRVMYYGEEDSQTETKFTEIDKLPSIEPMETPMVLNFGLMLQNKNYDYITMETKLQSEWITELHDWTIPIVNTAMVTIDPRFETGMKGSGCQMDLDKAMKNLKYSNKKDQVPKNTREMMLSPLLPLFKAAVDSELSSLNSLGTWSMLPIPEGKRAVGSRLIYDLKWDLEKDCLAKAKARLICQGFSQIPYDSYDPNQISSPVMKASSLNAINIMAAKLGLHLHSLDVKNAYITATLDEKIWIKLPSFLQVKEDGKISLDNTVLLNKALYGLKNSSSAWFKELKSFLFSLDFTQSNEDPCVFTYTGVHGVCILGTHVDDILSASTERFFEDFLLPAATKWFPFGVTSGTARQFLGCMIEQDLEKGEVSISQEKRIEKLGEMFNITTGEKTPLPTGDKLNKLFELDSLADTDSKQQETLETINSDEKLPSFSSYKEIKTYYRSYTGNLVYMCCYGRPDIQAITYRLARYQESPGIRHIRAARRIIKYLLFTKERKLIFGRQEMKDTLASFSDSSFADCPATGRSTGGYVHFLFGSYLSSRSFKMNCVTRSVTEAEFYTMSACAADSIFYKNFFNFTLLPVLNHHELHTKSDKGHSELKHVNMIHSTKQEFKGELLSKDIHPFQWMNEEDTIIYGDNSSAIQQANYGSNKRSKHIRIHNSYIWEQIHIFKRIKIGKVATEYNVADLQTKPLKAELFDYHTKTLMGERHSFKDFNKKIVNYTDFKISHYKDKVDTSIKTVSPKYKEQRQNLEGYFSKDYAFTVDF